MNAARAARRARLQQTWAQLVAAIAALVVLIFALADGVRPQAPLWALVALLAGGLLARGLLAGPLTRLAGGRTLHTYALSATACAAMLFVSFELPDDRPGWPISPLWIVALVLGLGLAARPLRELVGGRLLRGSAQSIAALVAMLVLIWNLSAGTYYWLTYSPTQFYSSDMLPMGRLLVAYALLSLALGAAVLDGARVRRFLQSVATVAALGVLVVTVAAPPAPIHPPWMFWTAIAVLGFGLLADRFSWSGARGLAERVEQLSRTRSGALDVQANELRRIERDLHDGAQVRLVALSMKLDAPRTATATTRRRRRCCARHVRTPRRRSASCGSSPAGSRRRCSAIAAWRRRCAHWRSAPAPRWR